MPLPPAPCDLLPFRCKKDVDCAGQQVTLPSSWAFSQEGEKALTFTPSSWRNVANNFPSGSWTNQSLHRLCADHLPDVARREDWHPPDLQREQLNHNAGRLCHGAHCLSLSPQPCSCPALLLLYCPALLLLYFPCALPVPT
eukprot:751366-Hanusia_phi.AAC.1